MATYCSWTGTVLCIIMVIQTVAANQFKVGGNRGWVLPSGSEKESFNQWAERNRFIVGDTLVFVYNPSVDSVLEVSKEDYDSCTTSNPIHSYKDGNTDFTFPKHGPFYFISGNATNCQKGQKLVIVVLSPRNQRSKTTVSPAPSPTVASPPPSSVAPTPSTVAPTPSTVASPPSPSPSTVASPPSPVSPSVAPVASPSFPPTVSSVPAMAPGNPAQELSAPAPAPLVSEGGGVVPSKSKGDVMRPCFASAALALLGLAFSGAF